jgi:prophage antirepressor-like protein
LNDLQIFNNPEFGQVRVIAKENEPWFVGKDIADILGYKNSRDAINKHTDMDERDVAKCDTLGGRTITANY